MRSPRPLTAENPTNPIVMDRVTVATAVAQPQGQEEQP